MRQKTNLHTPALIDRTTIKVRFSEIDSMQIVWHGEYVRYFEDGRESFGKHYGLGYMDYTGPQTIISLPPEVQLRFF